jgi:hypothetical protein
MANEPLKGKRLVEITEYKTRNQPLYLKKAHRTKLNTQDK